MKKASPKVVPQEILLSAPEFLESYNKNMPKGYPNVSLEILQKFKTEHASLFKKSGLWSLDQHRKRMIDWLPQNI
jgi:hypothetical protein